MSSDWLKISHHRHSGRFRSHDYTSYVPLALLLLIVGVALTFGTAAASSGPGAGSIGLTGGMPGPAPTVAATITSPTNGQHITSSPVEVKGTCPKDTLVEIFKNNIFAGSTTCSASGNNSSSGTYSVSVDLLLGQNQLVARVYNALNEPGPDSNIVTVYYDVLPPQGSAITPLNFAGTQLILNTNAVYRGAFPNQNLSVPLEVIGGTQPYAVNVQWGDTTNKVVPRNNNLTFYVDHAYKAPGNYQITFQASDSQNRVAFLTVAAIVNGQTGAASGTTNTPKSINKLLVLWPLYASTVAMLVAFWLGERREKHIIGRIATKPHIQM
jgi:hypothetical protein